MFKSVLSDPRLTEAEFICVDGPIIIVSADVLRTVLPNLRDHYGGKIWGPFNINPHDSTIDGHLVDMRVEWNE